MIRCPFCGGRLTAIPSIMDKEKFAGGCENPNCDVIFRTKKLYSKEDAVGIITDLVKYSRMALTM